MKYIKLETLIDFFAENVTFPNTGKVTFNLGITYLSISFSVEDGKIVKNKYKMDTGKPFTYEELISKYVYIKNIMSIANTGRVSIFLSILLKSDREKLDHINNIEDFSYVFPNLKNVWGTIKMNGNNLAPISKVKEFSNYRIQSLIVGFNDIIINSYDIIIGG